METIKSRAELKIAITAIEGKLLIQKKEITTSIYEVYESINPISIAKTAIHRVKAQFEEKDNSVNTIISLGTGLLLKKLIFRKPGTIVKNIIATLFQLALTHTVSNNGDAIKVLNDEIQNGVGATD